MTVVTLSIDHQKEETFLTIKEPKEFRVHNITTSVKLGPDATLREFQCASYVTVSIDNHACDYFKKHPKAQVDAVTIELDDGTSRTYSVVLTSKQEIIHLKDEPYLFIHERP